MAPFTCPACRVPVIWTPLAVDPKRSVLLEKATALGPWQLWRIVHGSAETVGDPIARGLGKAGIQVYREHACGERRVA